MYSVREVIETFIRKLQADITAQTVLISRNDFFEATKLPSLIIQGPEITENRSRRTKAKLVTTDKGALTYDERNYPRFYHFDFDFILTAEKETELLDLQEKVMKFFLKNPELSVNADDSIHMVELIPIGGLARPNLTNLRQASGKYRLEDVEIYDDSLVQGKLIDTRIFEYLDLPGENPVDTRTHTNPGA
ncbi:MAG: hypothetical protein ACE5GM_10900 [bacterium]